MAATAATSATSATSPGAVVVTGISGRLGRLLAQELHRRVPVVGIDRRPFAEAPKDVQMHRIDIRSRRCEDVFRTNQIDAVFHLNIMHNPRRSAEEHHTFNVMGTQQVLEYCVHYKIPKLVVLSTANVYGPHPRNQMYLTEDAPLMAIERDVGVRDLVAMDMLVSAFFWQHPEIETTILRPVHICGSVHNAPSNYLRLPRIPKLLGFDPMVQVIHEMDVVKAMVATLEGTARGVFNVTGPAAVPLSAVLSELGKPVIEVPHLLFEPMVKYFYRARFWSFPYPELDYLKYGCVVDGSRIRKELGFESERSIKEIVAMFRTPAAQGHVAVRGTGDQ